MQNKLFYRKIPLTLLAPDQSADVYSVDIGYRVNDSRGEFLGVIKAVTNVDLFYKP